VKKSIVLVSIVLACALGVSVLAQSRVNVGGRADQHRAGRGLLPALSIGNGELAANAVTTDKIAANGVSETDLTNGCVTVSKASTRVKTKVTVTDLGGTSASQEKYIFVAPVDCTIVSVGILSDTTTSSSNAGTNWSFQVANLTVSSNLCAAATYSSQTELTGDAYYDLGVDQNLAAAANAVIELQISSNGTPTSLGSAELSAVIEWY